VKLVCGSAGFTRRKREDGRELAIPDGSPHYRLILPGIRAAEHLGWEVVVTDTLEVSKAGVIAGVNLTTGEHLEADVILLQRWMGANGPTVIERARANGQVVIQDIDDDFERLRPTNRAYREGSPESNVKHYRRILAASDGVICSTPTLAKRLRKYNERTVVYRNAVDPAMFAPSQATAIGWAGHLGYRSGDLEHVRPGIERLFGARPDLSFVHVGSAQDDTDTAAERLGIPASQAACIPGAIIGEYPKLLTHIGIGIVPLAPVAFNRAKSWLKGIEYAACGIPFVASALPEYLALAQAGAGIIAHTPLQWTDNLARLADDAQYAADVRESGYAAVNDLAVNTTWQTWTDNILRLSPTPISA